MVKNNCLAKSISDASWSMFRFVLMGKAERANRLIVAVSPAYTSQSGLVFDRDANAAVNMAAKSNIRAAVGQHSHAALAA